MEFVVETSLYITHSRHDINKFLSSRPALPYSSIDAIYKAGHYHKNLDLIDDIMTGPANPDEDPSYYRKLAAREAFQRAVVGIMAENRLVSICFPPSQVLAPTREELRNGRWPVLAFPTNTLIAAQTWLPSICLPAGFTTAGVPIGIEMVVLRITNRNCSDWAMRSSRPLIIAVRHRARPLFDFHSQGPCLLLAYCLPIMTSAAQHYYSFNSSDFRKAAGENRVRFTSIASISPWFKYGDAATSTEQRASS